MVVEYKKWNCVLFSAHIIRLQVLRHWNTATLSRFDFLFRHMLKYFIVDYKMHYNNRYAFTYFNILTREACIICIMYTAAQYIKNCVSMENICVQWCNSQKHFFRRVKVHVENRIGAKNFYRIGYLSYALSLHAHLF